MSRALITNTAGNALFVVIEDVLYSVAANGVRTSRGVLSTRRGHVGWKVGLNQLVLVDGMHGYVYDLTSHAFTEITSDGWRGSYTVDQLGGYYSFIDPNSQTAYNSASEDASTLDASEVITANSGPDKLVGQKRLNNVLLYFGETTIEPWQINTDPTTINDTVFVPNTGTTIPVGLMAAHTVQEMDNSVFWLGRDENGAGMVYMMQGFTARRISTQAQEEVIQEAIRNGEDISQSVAYPMQMDGHSFYCLNIPGLDTVLAYDAATQQWAERAELGLNRYAPHRVKYHAYCYGKHLGAGDDDIIYAFDPNVYTNNGDVLVRDRISPHYATPQLERINYPLFELDCEVGFGKAGQSEAKVLMKYSNDGGYEWSGWREASLGAIGQKTQRARWLRNGSARDRVHWTRCTDNVKFNIVNANIEAH